ncbi:MAG: hypothetical protein IJ313_06000 [Clostridia bacterium]|nr:hypothetical protein [Clostridia bacterium]
MRFSFSQAHDGPSSVFSAQPAADKAHHPGRAHADHPNGHPLPSPSLLYIQQHDAYGRHAYAYHDQKKLHRQTHEYNHHAAEGEQTAQLPSQVQDASAHAHPSFGIFFGISYAAHCPGNTKALQTFV